jgi:hypothetical protein
VKFAKARTAANGKAQIDIAIPSFGEKNHAGIDWHFDFIRKAAVPHGARHDESQLREVVTTKRIATDVRAILLIGQRLMTLSLQHRAGSAESIASSQRASGGQTRFVPPTEQSRRSVQGWGMSLRRKRRIWDCSSAPSPSSERKQRSC